jgi:hypothetical protein
MQHLPLIIITPDDSPVRAGEMVIDDEMRPAYRALNLGFRFSL